MKDPQTFDRAATGQGRELRCLFSGALVFIAGLVLAPTPPAEAAGGQAQFKSQKQQGSPQVRSRSEPRIRRPQSYGTSYRERNRRLITPGASNTPSSVYRKLDAPQVQQRGYIHAPIYQPQPYVVYVEQPAFAPQPSYPTPPPPEPRYREPPRPEPQPQPVPVYVINQPQGYTAPAPPEPEPPAPPPKPRSTEPVDVKMRIHPADAKVYLDDELLGTAAEVIETGFKEYPPGVYVLEVTHPDHPAQRLVFGVSGDQPVSVQIDLTESRPSKRSRVK